MEKKDKGKGKGKAKFKPLFDTDKKREREAALSLAFALPMARTNTYATRPIPDFARLNRPLNDSACRPAASPSCPWRTRQRLGYAGGGPERHDIPLRVERDVPQPAA